MSNTTMNTTTTTVVDDNQAYWIALVTLLNKTISQYGMALIWLVGNIGSVFNCIIFYQPTFRKSPCSMYFIASSVAQFFTFNFALFTRMLQFGYNIQTVNTVLLFCKIRFYLFYIFVAVPRYFIILASVDRYFASSRNALRRQWSSRKIALRLIIGNVVFWCLIYIQVLIFYEIQNGTCLAHPGPYGVFFSIYISIDSGILPLSLMIIFGFLTIRSVRQIGRRITPTALIVPVRPAQTSVMSKKDVQFHRILVNQVCLFIVFNSLNPCYLLYQAFTINIYKSPLRRTVNMFISNMTYALVYLGFALTFVTFLLSSKMFRREFHKFIQTKILGRPSIVRTGRGINTVVSLSRPY